MQRQQVFLTPGTYELGAGRRQVFTPQTLKKLVSNTLDLQARGYQVPVLAGHPAPGSEAGSPRLALENATDQPGQTPVVGHLQDLWQNEDGGLEFRLCLSDEADAQLPEFTSPEIRRRFQLPDGTEVGPVIAHVALTDAPRNTQQPPLETIPEAVQFSLTDLVESAQQQQTRIRQTCRAQVEAARFLSPALRERLVQVVDTVQLSQDADAEPHLSIGSLLTMLEETLPPGLTHPESVQGANHPGGEAFFGLDEQEKTRQLVQRQLSQAGFLKV